jgi:hypothetical protein
MSEQILKDRIIAVDFDGTIAQYGSWKGVGVFGDPVLSAQWALKMLKNLGATIIVHTCRKETNLVIDYLREHKIPYDHVNYSPRNVELKLSPKKIAADIYIDDKAIGFRGQWRETYLDVVNFRRWEHEYGAISSKG